jgi:hypothetical protein
MSEQNRTGYTLPYLTGTRAHEEEKYIIISSSSLLRFRSVMVTFQCLKSLPKDKNGGIRTTGFRPATDRENLQILSNSELSKVHRYENIKLFRN